MHMGIIFLYVTLVLVQWKPRGIEPIKHQNNDFGSKSHIYWIYTYCRPWQPSLAMVHTGSLG